MSNSVMKFESYKVDKIKFVINETFKGNEEGNNLPLSIEHTVLKNEDDNSIFKVCLLLTAGEENETSPFYLETQMSGVFKMDENNEYLIGNAIAILYPYLRGAVTSITASANIPPLVLPVVNVAKMLGEDE